MEVRRDGRSVVGARRRSEMAAWSALVVFVLAVVALVPSLAQASCSAEFPDLAREAASVFVGTSVEEAGDHNRIEVAEVWRGPDLAEEVWIEYDDVANAGLGPGEVVVAVIDADTFLTNDCLVTSAVSDVRGELVPDEVRPAVAGGLTGAPPNLVQRFPVASLTLVVGLAVIAFGGWRRARRAGQVGWDDVETRVG